jgi:tetratricopeptide (TPR) repeat protein
LPSLDWSQNRTHDPPLALWAARNYAQTGDYYQRALALARTLDDPAALARSLNRLGNWHLNVEQPHEALHRHQEALATFQGLQDRSGLAETLDLLGMASYLSGGLIQSTAYYQQAVSLFRELDKREGLISSLVTLMHSCGNYQTETLVPAATSWADAHQMDELALKVAREIGQRSGEAYALRALGQCLGPRGEYAQALELAQDGLRIAEEIGHRQWMAAGHWVLGALYLDLLVLPTAQQHLEQAVALAQESGSLFWIRTTTGFLAMTQMLQHDVTQAESLLTTALDPDTPSQTLGQRVVWYARAELALTRNNPSFALPSPQRRPRPLCSPTCAIVPCSSRAFQAHPPARGNFALEGDSFLLVVVHGSLSALFAAGSLVLWVFLSHFTNALTPNGRLLFLYHSLAANTSAATFSSGNSLIKVAATDLLHDIALMMVSSFAVGFCTSTPVVVVVI